MTSLTGLIMLIPLPHPPTTNTLTFRFNWHDFVSNLELMPTKHTDALTGATGLRELRDGHVFSIATVDPHMYLLPIPAFLQLDHQMWTAIGIAGLLGAFTVIISRALAVYHSVLSVLSAVRNMVVSFTSFSSCPFTKDSASKKLSKICYSPSDSGGEIFCLHMIGIPAPTPELPNTQHTSVWRA